MIQAIHAATPGALDGLLRAVRPSLVGFFARRWPGASAEDLAQIALMRIARAATRIDPDRAERYITTVARNVLRTAYERARQRPPAVPIEHAGDLESPEPLPDKQLEYRELALAIHRAAITELHPVQRRIILGLLRGLTPTEIAVQCGVSTVSVRTRLCSARLILRRALGAYLAVDARETRGPRAARSVSLRYQHVRTTTTMLIADKALRARLPRQAKVEAPPGSDSP
ncbi:MAG: hypothetical protein NVS4B3_04650 [Gemmatimonadaceae bacterium]